MIALLSALEEEIRELKKGISIRRTAVYRDCRVYEGVYNNQDTLLVLTGMGKECAERATRFVLEKYPIRVLVSTGFGGALNEKTKVGDIVVYSKLSCEESPIDSANEVLWCDSDLVSAASRSIKGTNFQCLPGNGLTVSKVCDTPQSKYRLGRDFSADVVDMESYWTGKIAEKQRVRFLAVRSIFDAVQDDLSFLDPITERGRVRPLKVLGHFICHPGQVKQAAKCLGNGGKAGKNLAAFLYELMKEI